MLRSEVAFAFSLRDMDLLPRDTRAKFPSFACYNSRNFKTKCLATLLQT